MFSLPTLSAVMAQQKSRLILWAVVMYGVGIGVYFSMQHEPAFGFVVLSVVLFTALWACVFRLKDGSVGGLALWLCSGALFLIAAGLFTAQARSILIYTPMLQKAHGPKEMSATIDSIELREQGSRVVFKKAIIEDLAAADTPRKIRLVLRKDEGLSVGDRVKMLVRLNPPSPPVAPGAFDFQRYAYYRGIGAVGFSYTQPEILEEARGHHNFFKDLQLGISKRLQDRMEYPGEAFAMTLLAGQRGAINEEDKQAMRDAGLAHLLAISGMHIGMVAGGIFFFMRFLMALFPGFALTHPIKKYAAVFALLGILFYAALVGASVSTQRALIMTGLVLLAIMVDRSPFSLRVVALAAFAVLLFSPESLMSVSFHMSFAAVTALIAFFDWARTRWSGLYSNAGMIKRFGLYAGGIVVTTLIAEIAIAPFALFHFQHHSTYSLIGNLLAVPVMGFVIMPGLVLALIFMPLGLDFIPLWFVEQGIGWMVAAAHWTAGLDGAVLNLPAFDPLGLLLIVIGGLFLCLGIGWVRGLSVPFVALGIAFAVQTPQPDILISDKADLVAVRGSDGQLMVSTRRKNKYAAENWLRMNGQEGQKPNLWPKEGKEEGLPLSCDTAGCRGMINGFKIAIAHEDAAWQEDCGWADIMIASVPVEEGCRAQRIIDRFDVWENGAHSIYLDGDIANIKSVRGERGNRLWTGNRSEK